jgi:hypothetical protein
MRRQYQILTSDSSEATAALLARLGYTAHHDGAQGTHWQRQHSHIWLCADGELHALGETYEAALAGRCVLTEHSEVVR